MGGMVIMGILMIIGKKVHQVVAMIIVMEIGRHAILSSSSGWEMVGVGVTFIFCLNQ
jgi:hypothetical protein